MQARPVNYYNGSAAAGIRARLRVRVQRNRSQTSDIDHLVLEATVISAVLILKSSRLLRWRMPV